MTKEELFNHVKKTYNITPDHPFKDEAAVVRHKNSKKWFGLVMTIPLTKLGETLETKVEVMNVKCDPMLISSLKKEDGFYPAYHMNKSKWITILLKKAKADMIKMLLDMSFELTKK